MKDESVIDLAHIGYLMLLTEHLLSKSGHPEGAEAFSRIAEICASIAEREGVEGTYASLMLAEAQETVSAAEGRP